MDTEKQKISMRQKAAIAAIVLLIGGVLIYYSNLNEIILLVVATTLLVAKAKANLRVVALKNKSTTEKEGEQK